MLSLRTVSAAVGGVLLCSASGYVGTSVVNDTIMYFICRRLALQSASEHPLLIQELGQPLRLGDWYKSSVSFSHEGNVARCYLTLIGPRAASDIYVQAVRKTSKMPTLLYNTLGPAEWRLVTCEATVSAAGSITQRISLLKEQVESTK